MKHRGIKIKARIKLLPTEEGGRNTGVGNKYRPNHVFEYADGQILASYIGEIIMGDKDWIFPGEIKDAIIKFLDVPSINKYLIPGRKWWLHEGGQRVGVAELIDLL